MHGHLRVELGLGPSIGLAGLGRKIITRLLLGALQPPSENYRAAAIGKKRDASTNQSNNFVFSRKRFKPSTPGSTVCFVQTCE